MNAAARVMTQGSVFRGEILFLQFSKEMMLILLLACAVLASSFSLVIVKDKNRRLFSDLQSLEYKRDRLEVDWSKLLLERSSWATQSRVEALARTRLHMRVPQHSKVILVR